MCRIHGKSNVHGDCQQTPEAWKTVEMIPFFSKDMDDICSKGGTSK